MAEPWGAETGPLERLMAAARAEPRRIALCEGWDPRIAEAAVRARDLGLAQLSLVGPEAQVAEALKAAGAEPGDFETRDPRDRPEALAPTPRRSTPCAPRRA